MVEITWLPMRVETGTPEENGRLILVNGKLAAVFVHLSDDHLIPDLQGKWFLEAGLGPHFEEYKVFSTFEAVEAWVRESFENRVRARAEQTHPGNNALH